MSNHTASYIFIILSIIFVTSLASVCQAVEKNKFKNCDQTSFCQRNRQQKPFDQKLRLDTNSLQEVGNDIRGVIHDDTNNIDYSLTVSLTKGGAIRLKIDDIGASRARFEAKEALDPQLTFKKVTKFKNADSTIFIFGDTTKPDQTYQLVLNNFPFTAEVKDHLERTVIAINSHGLFKWEAHKALKVDVTPQPQNGQPLQDGQAYDEYGRKLGPDGKPIEEVKHDAGDEPVATSEYAEIFSTFTDSRPYGPMSVGIDLHFPNSDHLYGIPEHADSFNLRDTRPNIGDPYRLWNSDIPEYEMNSTMALYGAIPFMVSHSITTGTFGVLYLNPSETWVDIESEKSHSKNAGVVDLISNLVKSDTKLSGRLTHWFSETGLIDLWLMPGPHPLHVTKHIAEILGTIPMPPTYSLGFHQCRWNYFSGKEVMSIEKGYDDTHVPLDAIWLDIEYTENRSKKYFTWDPVAFADHIQLTRNLTNNGRRLITIIDPHIKKLDGYSCYDEGKANDYWVKDAYGNSYQGYCWPGESFWPDYLDPKVRDWWASKFEPSYFPGASDAIVDIWNDMNEPSVFNGPETSLPRDTRHIHDWEHRDIHNMYGFLMTKATYEGLAEYRAHLSRPFVLTRSFFAGSQRYAAAWTGDNMALWSHLKITIPMLLSLSISGMPFVGADVGGFFNNPESEELVVRWHQAGAMQPFFRNHAHHDAKHKEVFRFMGQTLDLLRNAIQLRYSYAPYMYTLFFEAHATGNPIMRPCYYHNPRDPHTLDLEEQHLLGQSLLVRPVLDKGVSKVTVYLPGLDVKTSWFDLNQQVIYEGGRFIDYPVTIATVPIFQRAGTIVPRQYRMRKSLELGTDDPVTLDIVLDTHDDGRLYANGHLYIDDRKSLSPDNMNGILIDLKFNGHVFYFRSSRVAKKVIFGGVERIVVYNWPSSLKLESVVVSSSDKQIGKQVEFDLDNPREDGTVRIDIKKPQKSFPWKDWELTFFTI